MPLPIVKKTEAELLAWLNDPLFHMTDPNCPSKHKEFCWADTVNCINCQDYKKRKLMEEIEILRTQSKQDEFQNL